jgi:histone H3/H4
MIHGSPRAVQERSFAFELLAVPERRVSLESGRNARDRQSAASRPSLGTVQEDTEEQDAGDEAEPEPELDDIPEDDEMEMEMEMEDAERSSEEDASEAEEEVSRILMGNDSTLNLSVNLLDASAAASQPKPKRAKNKKPIRVSRHGIPYSSLPAGVVKKLATTFARTSGSSSAKISKETLAAIQQASDWFFEQVSDDLGAYAGHAGRKTIDETDVVTLMQRYVQT